MNFIYCVYKFSLPRSTSAFLAFMQALVSVHGAPTTVCAGKHPSWLWHDSGLVHSLHQLQPGDCGGSNYLAGSMGGRGTAPEGGVSSR